jgi:chromosome partitioning protein
MFLGHRRHRSDLETHMASRVGQKGKREPKSPQTKIVVLSSPKGGTGKTTFAENLLVLAAQDGLNVLGVDFDPQQTLTKWYDRREKKRATRPSLVSFDVAPASIKSWQSVLSDIQSRNYDLAVVDLLPSVDEFIPQVHGLCEAADLVLVTTAATVNDLDSTGPWVGELLGLGFKVATCINRSNRRETMLGEARALMNEVGPLCPVDVRYLSDAHMPQVDGMVAVDKNKSNTKSDFEAVWAYVKREIKLVRPKRPASPKAAA